MGTLGGGNGDGPPPEGGGPSDGLPDLPPEWGHIVVPDDPAALADEAATVRRELRWERRHRSRRRMTGRTGPRPAVGHRIGGASPRVPLMIMAAAVAITVASLFAAAWPLPQRQPTTGQTTTRTTASAATLPALDLQDADGGTVPLRGLLPAVIVLVDECACDELVTATATAAAPPLTVIAVAGRSSPSPTGRTHAGVPLGGGSSVTAAGTTTAAGAPLRRLTDPTGQLRTALNLATGTGTAAVVLVTGSGAILDTVPNATSIEQYRASLARLAAEPAD